MCRYPYPSTAQKLEKLRVDKVGFMLFVSALCCFAVSLTLDNGFRCSSTPSQTFGQLNRIWSVKLLVIDMSNRDFTHGKVINSKLALPKLHHKVRYGS